MFITPSSPTLYHQLDILKVLSAQCLQTCWILFCEHQHSYCRPTGHGHDVEMICGVMPRDLTFHTVSHTDLLPFHLKDWQTPCPFLSGQTVNYLPVPETSDVHHLVVMLSLQSWHLTSNCFESRWTLHRPTSQYVCVLSHDGQDSWLTSWFSEIALTIQLLPLDFTLWFSLFSVISVSGICCVKVVLWSSSEPTVLL